MPNTQKEKCKIILSVKPNWANLILNGNKTVELRRQFTKLLSTDIEAFLYASAPVSAILGTVTIFKTLNKPPESLWHEVKHLAEVNKSEYNQYFDKAPLGTAIFLCKPKIFSTPLPLNQLRKDIDFSPPVSWRWAKHHEIFFMEAKNGH